MSIEKAKIDLNKLKNKSKFERMIHTAAILTDLLSKHDIKPIIVGGLSVELYTLNGYTTQDIDFVLNGRDVASDVFSQLGFIKQGKDWIHPSIGVSLEIPDNHLTGDYNKVTELQIGDRVVHVIGIEDIILDRLRSAVHWKSGVDREWGYRLLLMYYEEIDMEYIQNHAQHPEELNELIEWLKQAHIDSNDMNSN